MEQEEKKLELKFNWAALKRRVVGWLRDLILIIGVYAIGLVQDYVPNQEIKVLLIILLVSIVSIAVLIGEYFVVVDYKLQSFETELERQKKLG